MKLFLIALAALPLAAFAGPAPSPLTPEVDGGYLKLGFDLLSSFKFIAPEYDPLANPKAAPPTGEEQIPAVVKSWSCLLYTSRCV